MEATTLELTTVEASNEADQQAIVELAANELALVGGGAMSVSFY